MLVWFAYGYTASISRGGGFCQPGLMPRSTWPLCLGKLLAATPRAFHFPCIYLVSSFAMYMLL